MMGRTLIARADNEETAGNGRKGKACLKMKCNSLGLLASFTPGHQRQNLSSVHFAQIFIMNPQTLPRNNLTNLQFALTLRPRSPALRTRTPSTARCVRRSFAHSFLASQFRSKRNEKRESWRANERTPSRTARSSSVSQSQNFAFSDSSGVACLPLCISSTASSSPLFVRPRPPPPPQSTWRAQQLN